MKDSKRARNKPSSNAALTGVSHPAAEAIAALAYSIWEREGRPVGRDQEHWLEAELEIRTRSTPQP